MGQLVLIYHYSTRQTVVHHSGTKLCISVMFFVEKAVQYWNQCLYKIKGALSSCGLHGNSLIVMLFYADKSIQCCRHSAIFGGHCS